LLSYKFITYIKNQNYHSLCQRASRALALKVLEQSFVSITYSIFSGCRSESSAGQARQVRAEGLRGRRGSGQERRRRDGEQEAEGQCLGGHHVVHLRTEKKYFALKI
jgi:hypothetical protein